MSKIAQNTLIVMFIVVTLAATYLFWHQHHDEQGQVIPPQTQQQAQAPQQPQQNIPILGTDTLHIIINKTIAERVVLPGLKTAYGAVQGNPNLTGDRILQSQQVMEFIANNIYKKWPVLNSVPPPPLPVQTPAPPVKK